MQKSSLQISSCGGCGITQENMLRCSRCNQKAYCGKECQKKDWREHKPNCHPLEIGNSYMKERIGDKLWCNGNDAYISKEANNKMEEEISHLVTMNRQLANIMVMAVKGKNLDIELLDTRIPPFHNSFTKWPIECNMPECKLRLLAAYEFGRAAKQIYNSYITRGSESVDPKHVLRRLAGSSIEWFLKSEMGEINPEPYLNIYNPTCIHGFSNFQSIKENITNGSTIVSIGFVDLGILRESIYDNSLQVKPVIWIGYEASAYCVAKTASIIAMIQIGSSADAILQVWYSSAWSSETLNYFESAVKWLLEGNSSLTGVSHPDVQQILRIWKFASIKKSVKLSHARSGWLKLSTDYVLWRLIGNFKQSADRDALCLYCITGQLLDASYGSVVMFAHPSIKTDFQHVFQTISLEDLMTAKNNRAKDITEAAITHLRKGIQQLIQKYKENRIIINLYLCAVEPSDVKTLASIAALDPYTITWSNVCDYYQPKEFHEMARKCSGSNTIHHAYSMNWAQQIKGTFAIDLMISGITGKKLDGLLAAANATVKLSFNMIINADKVFLVPPVDDSRNILDFFLSTAHYENWIKSFFSTANLKDFKRQVQIMKPPFFSILSRCYSSVMFSFTYDEEIKFYDVNGPAKITKEQENGIQTLIDFMGQI